VRALFLTLALANLLFFGWSYWIDQPVAGRAAHANMTPLQLLAAAPATAAAAAAAVTAGSTAASPAATSGARCSSFGPLTDAVAAAVVSTALRARNFTPRERSVQIDMVEGYWVYIDNLHDADVRARALRRLARAGVRDAAALAGSGQVSVGLFNEQAGANLRAAAVRSAGLEPVIEARSHPVKEYWFDVELPNDVPPPAVGSLIDGLNLAAPPAWAACPAGNSAGLSPAP
jgi:hypothetical protein